ncbi:hypothetical protein HK405_011422 [Cladochytrium tenue]|nr:hypothetical protein HK405_011422 [Cladochytrium tenue]
MATGGGVFHGEPPRDERGPYALLLAAARGLRDGGGRGSLDVDSGADGGVGIGSSDGRGAAAALGFGVREHATPNARAAASRLIRGELAPDILETLAERSAVKLFVCTAETDAAWERNALGQDVWPFLAKLCRILDLDFEVLDL